MRNAGVGVRQAWADAPDRLRFQEVAHKPLACGPLVDRVTGIPCNPGKERADAWGESALEGEIVAIRRGRWWLRRSLNGTKEADGTRDAVEDEKRLRMAQQLVIVSQA